MSFAQTVGGLIELILLDVGADQRSLTLFCVSLCITYASVRYFRALKKALKDLVKGLITAV
jgi:hypothetical protein